MFVIASPAVLGRLSIVFRHQWDDTSYFEKLVVESTEGTTLASCVVWEFNVLVVHIVLFMSDLSTGTRGMTPPTSRSLLVAPSPLYSQCREGDGVDTECISSGGSGAATGRNFPISFMAVSSRVFGLTPRSA